MAVPVYQEVVTGTAEPTTNLSTPVPASTAIGGGSNMLYLAWVYVRDGSDWGATSISGGGLTFTRILHKLDTQVTLMLECWAGFGSPGASFTPQIDSWTQVSGPADTSVASCALHVARISGAHTATPTANPSATDTGGTDTSTAAHTETVSNANSLIISATCTRGFTRTAVDADYTQVATATAGTAGNVVTSFLDRRSAAAPGVGTDAISHTLNAAADWIVGAVEVREAAAATALLGRRRMLGVGA